MVAINDLEFVFSETGLDRGAYRSFPLALQSRVNDSVPANATSESQDIGSAVAERAKVPSTHSRNDLATSSSAQVPQRRAPVLEGLLSQLDEGQAAIEPGFCRAVTLIGAAGGVGTTTVAATLARISSSRGSRVLLLDSAEESIVPLYLGAGQIASRAASSWSFSPHPGSRQGTISVMACGGSDAIESGTSPWSRARSLSGMAGDVFIDSGSHRYTDGLPEDALETMCVVVLVPDIRCVLQVRRIEKIYADRGAAAPPPLYLLNRFEPGSSLHQQVCAMLTNHLGDRLAPLAVRNTCEVPEALSEGLTVVDHAPNSPVATEFVEVAGWLRHAEMSTTRLKQREAAAAGLP